MTRLLMSEILKLKNAWLLKLSFWITLLIPLLTLAMTLLSGQAGTLDSSTFIVLLRQNHIFLTLLVCNLLFSLVATQLFLKEFQYGTIVDILAIPVKRSSFLWVKEGILLLWMMGVGMASFVVCVLLGAIFRMDGLTLGNLWFGLWRYAIAVAISFIPLQLVIWFTLWFKNYVVSLAVSVVALIGSIVAFNTREIIFIYPFSIPFVITNFQEAITIRQVETSALSLAAVALVCLAGIFLGFHRMDIS